MKDINLHLIKAYRNAVVILAVLLVGVAIGSLSGCATTGQYSDSPSGFTHGSNDMGGYDDAVAHMCQEQALEVTYNIVAADPQAFTDQNVIDIVYYLYNNCLRDNGRGA